MNVQLHPSQEIASLWATLDHLSFLRPKELWQGSITWDCLCKFSSLQHDKKRETGSNILGRKQQTRTCKCVGVTLVSGYPWTMVARTTEKGSLQSDFSLEDAMPFLSFLLVERRIWEGDRSLKHLFEFCRHKSQLQSVHPIHLHNTGLSEQDHV